MTNDGLAALRMTNDARCAGKLARAKGPTFEAEGELAAKRRHLSFVMRSASEQSLNAVC
jgi:hypothetical protein